MAAACRLWDLPGCCLVAVLCLSSARACVSFERIDPRLLQLAAAALQPCSSVTLASSPQPLPNSCAVACTSDRRCLAFLHSTARCSLLTSACRAPSPQETSRLMIRRGEPAGALTWRFKTWRLLITKEKGSLAQAQAMCASYGMYIWFPDTDEEAEYVEQNVVSGLPSEYYYKDANRDVYNYHVWIGIVDRSNGDCLLMDNVTKCPVVRFHSWEPNTATAECVIYRKVNGKVRWDDQGCGGSKHFFCKSVY